MLRFILNFFKLIRGQFFVYVASETRNAHEEWISYFERLGQVEVNDEEDADYFLVFCPVKSRINTDIDEALEKMPVGKPVILVVMHHTFNPNMIMMDSRLQVTRPGVRLTVDCLFYEGRLLTSNLNRMARSQIHKCLGVSTFNVSYWFIWFLQWVVAPLMLLKKIINTCVSLVQSFKVCAWNCLNSLYCWLRWFIEWVCHSLGIRWDRAR